MMKNVIIVVLSAATLLFGCDANSRKEVAQVPCPDEVTDSIDVSFIYDDAFLENSANPTLDEYFKKKIFNRKYDWINDSIFDFRKTVVHYHHFLLPKIRNVGNLPANQLSDGIASGTATFKVSDLKKMLEDTNDEEIIFHFASLHPDVANKLLERMNKVSPEDSIKIAQLVHKPLVIGVAKSKSKQATINAIAPQICPPPKGCLK
jgi:hypothetical protein